jgi:4-amino-4-deoxy-L-arabinose transferase-like glycosyltransferase
MDVRREWVAWRAPAALLLVALVVRLAFMAATPDYRPSHDDGQYDRLACAISVSGIYPRSWSGATAHSCGTRDGGRLPSAFRPPGYPALLAGVYAVSTPLTDDRWTAGRLAQVALGVLQVALIGLLGARLWGRRAGLAALAVSALAPPLIVVGGSLTSDLLFATLVLGAVLAAPAPGRDTLRWTALAGVLVGLAALTRPYGLVLMAPLAIAAWRVARAPGALVLVGAALLVVAPWTVRNAVQMSAVVPISTHTGEALAGTYNHGARTRTDYPGAWRPPRRVADFADVYAHPRGEVWRQRELTRRSVRFAGEHPGYVAEVSARNTLRLLHLEDRDWWRLGATTMSLPATAGEIAGYAFFPLAALALAGAATSAARRAPGWLWLVPLLLAATTVPIVGETRMRAPIDPFLVLLAALALTHGVERARRLRPEAAPC